MAFLEKNWFSLGVLFICLLGVVLFFNNEATQRNLERQQQLASLSNSCQRLASQKKLEISQTDSDIYLSLYEYKYNPTYTSCILIYRGSYFGSAGLSGLLGHDTFEVDNLTTGESILSKRVDPGPAYAEANTAFIKLQMQYIGSTTPIK